MGRRVSAGLIGNVRRQRGHNRFRARAHGPLRRVRLQQLRRTQGGGPPKSPGSGHRLAASPVSKASCQELSKRHLRPPQARVSEKHSHDRCHAIGRATALIAGGIFVSRFPVPVAASFSRRRSEPALGSRYDLEVDPSVRVC